MTHPSENPSISVSGAIVYFDGWNENEQGEVVGDVYVRRAITTIIPVTDEFLAYLSDKVGNEVALDILNAASQQLVAQMGVSAEEEVAVYKEEAIPRSEYLWRQIHGALSQQVMYALDPSLRPEQKEEVADAIPDAA